MTKLATKPTLRQELKQQAESELDILRNQVVDAAAKLCPHYVTTQDILTLAASQHTKSLRNKMVSKIVADKERELLALLQDQTDFGVSNVSKIDA